MGVGAAGGGEQGGRVGSTAYTNFGITSLLRLF